MHKKINSDGFTEKKDSPYGPKNLASHNWSAVDHTFRARGAQIVIAVAQAQLGPVGPVKYSGRDKT